MAALAVILILVGVYVIAKAEGVDVGAQVSSLGADVSSEISSVTGGLLGSSDPISIAMPLIQGFESFSPTRYPDPPGSGKYSIAWGHQIQPGEPYDENSVVSRDEGDQLLRTDMGAAYACVQNNVTAELTANQIAALISFCFNVGCGAFEGSTLLSLLNQGDIEGAAAQFPQWIHAGGQVSSALESRRAQEQELFNS